MKPQRLTFGNSQSHVILIDEFSGKTEHIRAIAAAMAPFPPAAGNYYPGLRRYITNADSAAYAYSEDLLQAAAQFIGGTFDIDAFELLNASFSLVTQAPQSLSAKQRAPHFDDTDANYIALLHYLSPTPGTGTAFYRHRATGIERVTPANVEALLTMLRLESPSWPQSGYIIGSNDFFEQVGEIEAIPDRLVIYQGCLLHSGIISPDMPLSDNPLTGRLTANLFIRGS